MAKQTVEPQAVRNYFQGVVEELKKVTWPTRKETTKLTMVVMIISLIIGAYIGIIDSLLTLALETLAI